MLMEHSCQQVAPHQPSQWLVENLLSSSAVRNPGTVVVGTLTLMGDQAGGRKNRSSQAAFVQLAECFATKKFIASLDYAKCF